VAPALAPADRKSLAADAAERSAALQALDAQSALLPYALIFFGVSLPIFAWACSYAADRAWMSASFAIFAINWAAFYAQVDWMKRHPERQDDVALRTRIQIMGGLLWAAALAQICAIGLGAGSAREPILLLAAGGAAACVFFSAPNIVSLLIVGPAASAPPLLALYADASTRQMGQVMMAAIALVMALSLILNRLFRRMFALADERARLVEERARSLDEAERAAKAKSDLVATLSQEIRNGLTGVAHVLAAAGASGRVASTREQLNAALTSAQDLIAVLNATLDTVATEPEELKLELRPLDLPALARDVVQQLRPQATAKGLELAIHVDDAVCDPAAGAVVADAVRTRQILANLVGNAVKYTMRGRIELRLEPLGADRVRLEIADTGPGLSAEELEVAFQPFQRVSRTGAGVPGAGLGLSLSRRLAHLMHGEVTAESAIGVGSCFRLDMPIDRTARLEPAPAAPAPSPDVPVRPARALRVLIAEDEPLNAAMLRTVLEQLGHQTLHAHDGRRAFDLAQICDVDLIMLDGRMPEMDGPEAARAIRALPGPGGRAPIVAVIGGDADEAQAFQKAGVEEVLRKPVNVASVARAIAAAMREEQPRLRVVS
jgi:signal transduction histidine kinase/ActR/RegA family two-component response regulator